MSGGVAIVGIGCRPFGRYLDTTARGEAVRAVREALDDAGLSWPEIDYAVGGSMGAGSADTLVSELGLTGVPFVNVLNGCATGTSSLVCAVQAIASGAAETALVVGFDSHPRGAFTIRPEAMGLGHWYGATGLAMTSQFFALKIQRYLHEHGVPQRLLAAVASKAFRNGSINPNAWRRKPLSVADVEASAMLSDPLRQYMLCSPGDGAAALVLCSSEPAQRLRADPVYVAGAAVRTRRPGSFEVLSPSLSVRRGDSPTVDAARAAMEAAGIGPSDVDVAQLQDTDAGAELIHLAETGLCEHGEQTALIDAGDTEIGGRLPINTDGGCLANGEPIGASGLRQIHENVLQLRGHAGPRQVAERPRVAFSHVYGAPGLSACTVLTR
ncbi:acetyl-CoA acetyltransferase [Mycobacterium intermedium]|uniref:Acetyl-CoA acetyltransferase n=1 Tax=Mycobacterium intermedium TaxID=28445 RepID=A0A1E3SL62_MYCIE|nr:thiolase family protein [Mycobacterium intermedium]MCV6963467.1 thiolase family protein [Mycobacterium intermedium]ODR02852.1 acetyl-CoA acetyltransferase [Mycobacterium intermedium]OPE49920.1 acetyl-CoA acetyltransferase [Mycobacterium intermedium]ORB02771.1 acetyl-CoA acetyltransferase [Mycobacterium intermedium]